tara:strand:- start:508 stop:693 length:186 start_codon:yes stop_codon:yes gene_type:complete
MIALKIIFNILVLYLFFSFLIGCTVTDDVGCMPVHIGTGYDDEGMMKTIYTNEVGCPPLDY